MNTNNSSRETIISGLTPIAEVLDEHRPLLEGTQIVPFAPNNGTVPYGLAQRYKETEILLSRNDLPVRFLGYAPIFSGTKTYFGKDSDWAVMNLSQDPLFRYQNNNLYAPLSVVEEVQDVVKAGIKLDAIFIAHEVPKGKLKQGQAVPIELIEPPPSIEVQRRLNFLERTSRAWWKLITRTSVGAVAAPVAAGVVTLVAGTTLIAASAASASKAVGNAAARAAANAEARAAAKAAAEAAAARAASASYDPALLGVQFDPQWTTNGQPVGLSKILCK